MNVTVAVEEVHIGDTVSIGGPFKEVSWKAEYKDSVVLGFGTFSQNDQGAYITGDRVTITRGTLIDIGVFEGDQKAYLVYDEDGIRTLSVIPFED